MTLKSRIRQLTKDGLTVTEIATKINKPLAVVIGMYNDLDQNGKGVSFSKKTISENSEILRAEVLRMSYAALIEVVSELSKEDISILPLQDKLNYLKAIESVKKNCIREDQIERSLKDNKNKSKNLHNGMWATIVASGDDAITNRLQNTKISLPHRKKQTLTTDIMDAEIVGDNAQS